VDNSRFRLSPSTEGQSQLGCSKIEPRDPTPLSLNDPDPSLGATDEKTSPPPLLLVTSD
ncbi:hypothetical protein GW17_00044083, partial [Ensete ventricosum]